MMNNFLRKTITIAIAVSITAISRDRAQAQTEIELLQQIEQYDRGDRNNNIEQVTNVKQLRDVLQTDWSYEALRSLSDRYGCISGFPDGTYRGNQAITRNEFAAGLNSCFEQIERSVNSSNTPTTDSLESIRYKNYSPEAELSTLEGKVDELESRTNLLEENQFSPTTKIDGSATFGVTTIDSD